MNKSYQLATIVIAASIGFTCTFNTRETCESAQSGKYEPAIKLKKQDPIKKLLSSIQQPAHKSTLAGKKNGLSPALYKEAFSIIKQAQKTLKINHTVTLKSTQKALPAFALDKEIHVNPTWWNKLTQAYKRYLIYHEASHIYYKHSIKRAEKQDAIYGSKQLTEKQKLNQYQIFCRAQEKEADIHALNGLAKEKQWNAIKAFISNLEKGQKAGEPPSDWHPGFKESIEMGYKALSKRK